MRSRQFTVAIVLCALASALVLYAASRTWLVEVVVRPDPLPPTSTPRSGGWLVPLLPALALVGLAGAGGLLATRGRARTGVAALVTLVGLGIPVSVSRVLTRPGVAIGWVIIAAVAGLVVAAVGMLAVRRGRTWPTMGSRYERPGTTKVRSSGRSPEQSRGRSADESREQSPEQSRDDAPDAARGADTDVVDSVNVVPGGDSGHGQRPVHSGAGGDLRGAGLWDALDRGEDPTKG